MMNLPDELKRRILVLDGAMGSMIQSLGLDEQDYHFEGAPETVELKGNHECLNLSRPDCIRDIHLRYIRAGADIIETNSFSANRIGQEQYGCGNFASQMAYQAAAIARQAVAGSGRDVLVAGSVGPTGKSLTLAQNLDRPTEREYDFDTMTSVLQEEIDALVRGGVDFIQLETCFDALVAKSAIVALQNLGNPVPLVISVTVSDRSGRTLTGQTLEAFYRSVCHAPTLAAFGINCALGAVEMARLVREISGFSHHPLVFYPNAGLPDEHGCYCEAPDVLADVARTLASEGMLNIAGGCCGTTPDHISALCAALRGYAPRRINTEKRILMVSGLDAYGIDSSVSFTNIGERTNVAGSKKFARLIASGQYEEALQVASAQIAGGANIIDVNMDDAMLDSTAEMRNFLRYAATDPAVSKAAVMIDSSHFETIVEGLKNVQGKCIVNSISLKDGEEEFLRRASVISSFGAAMVVMAFDEQGQACSYDRKIGICARSYRLLTEKAGIDPHDIIFDVNVLSIGTGIAEHARFGVDFIEAVRWVKANLPGALTSGGISNLSFAFRGNNAVREAMHSAFLYNAVAAGLDMAIVNPQMLQVYDEIDPELLRCIEDVIFDRDAEATSRLVALAAKMNEASAGNDASQAQPDILLPVEERLQRALIKGDGTRLKDDVLECLEKLHSAIAVIEGPLVGGMEKVGNLFSDGKMFLPQIVRSAKIMKDAVAVLQPYIDSESGEGHRPKVVIATVRGDVHDIGKNIVGTVLQCSGFQLFDLGVMAPSEEIIATAIRENADIIAVSGLITPSLSRMEELCRALAAMNSDIPLFVGGAAASAVHTAVRLAPLYDNVHYRADASATAVMAKRYLASPDEFIQSERAEQKRLRNLKESADCRNACQEREGMSVCVERSDGGFGFVKDLRLEDVPRTVFPASQFAGSFDWKLFRVVCGLSRNDERFRDEALEFLNDDRLTVCCCARFESCHREGNLIVGAGLALPMLRQDAGARHSLADYFPTAATGLESQLGMFAVSVSGIDDEDGSLVLHAVKVALAETVSAWLHERFSTQVPEEVRVIMPAVGYACCPDHSLKRDILELLPDVGIRLTESCAMIPEASICGMVIAHPDANYHDIRHISAETAEEYASLRKFSTAEKELFLGHLL